MKIVINKCFGGFGLSPLATKKIADRKGLECYFFAIIFEPYKYKRLTLKEANSQFVWVAFSVPNPGDYNLNVRDEDGLYRGANMRAAKISLDFENRDDPDLVAVVEELGELANTRFSQLKVVEIPDGTEWEIDEYDGMETVHEKHRSWG